MAPPFEITSESQQLLTRLERLLGRYEGLHQPVPTAELRRRLRVESVRSTVAIEGNTLSSRQVDALWQKSADDSPEQEILEAHNALAAYEQLPRWNPAISKDFLAAHRVMMAGLLSHPGRWRRGNVGVMSNGRVAHIAPPANRVSGLIQWNRSFSSVDLSITPLCVNRTARESRLHSSNSHCSRRSMQSPKHSIRSRWLL